MDNRGTIAVLHAIKAGFKSPTALRAINEAISALMTIDDIKYYGLSPVKKEPATAGIDLKTLYEQMTAECDYINVEHGLIHSIEHYHQPDTPIFIDVIWDNDISHYPNVIKVKIVSINFYIKKE